MALAGNMLLLTYFIGRQESSAALIQALGVGSNYALLVQVGCGADLHSLGPDCCTGMCSHCCSLTPLGNGFISKQQMVT